MRGLSDKAVRDMYVAELSAGRRHRWPAPAPQNYHESEGAAVSGAKSHHFHHPHHPAQSLGRDYHSSLLHLAGAQASQSTTTTSTRGYVERIPSYAYGSAEAAAAAAAQYNRHYRTRQDAGSSSRVYGQPSWPPPPPPPPPPLLHSKLPAWYAPPENPRRESSTSMPPPPAPGAPANASTTAQQADPYRRPPLWSDSNSNRGKDFPPSSSDLKSDDEDRPGRSRSAPHAGSSISPCLPSPSSSSCPAASPLTSPSGGRRRPFPPHFALGSLIQLADGDLKKVEDLQTEDFLRSAEKSQEVRISRSVVTKLEAKGESAVIGFAVGKQKLKVNVIH